MIPNHGMSDYYLNVQNYDEILKCYDVSEKNIYLLNRDGVMFHMTKEDFNKNYTSFSIEKYFNRDKYHPSTQKDLILKEPSKDQIAILTEAVKETKLIYPKPTICFVRNYRSMTLSTAFVREYVKDKKYAEIKLHNDQLVIHFTDFESPTSHRITRLRNLAQVCVSKILVPVKNRCIGYKFDTFICVLTGEGIQVSFKILKGK